MQNETYHLLAYIFGQFCYDYALIPSFKNCHKKVEKFPLEKYKTMMEVLSAVLLLNCLEEKSAHLWRLNLVLLLAEKII